MIGTLTVHEAGNAIVTDLGRPTGPAVGLPLGGALDQYSARIANVLAGNDDGAPLIETTAMALGFVADIDILIAVTGADMELTVDGVRRPLWEPVSVRAGERVALSEMSAGLRSYVAVHGGIDAPFLRGSCAPDSGTGFGIRLAPGLALGLLSNVPPVSNPFFDAPLYHFRIDTPFFGDIAVIDVTDGPDVADFGRSAARLFSTPFTVGAKSNHVGLRFTGPLPERLTRGEMISRGVPVGAVEVPPGDELLILHRGRGVTAGYPVLAVVTSTSLDTLAQVRPGQRVVFRRVDIRRATETARARREHIASLRARVTTVFACLGRNDLTPVGTRIPHVPFSSLLQGVS